jgi:tetratricopeptide (TPR) repeat protein
MKTNTTPLRKTLLGISIFLLLAGFTVAATLEVECVGPDGKPLNRAIVNLQRIGGDQPLSEQTNRQGRVSFKKLEEGYYRVWARSEGMDPTYNEFFQLQGGDGTESVTLTFEAGDPNQPLYFEDAAQTQQAQTLQQQGNQALQQQRFDVAEAKYKEALDLYPSDPISHLNLAIAYLQQGKWDEAEEKLNYVDGLLDVYVSVDDPNNPFFGEQKETVRELKESIPVQKIAFAANKAMEEQNYGEAAAQYAKLVEIQPENVNALYMLAGAQVRGGNLDEGEETIDRALELAPNEADFKTLKTQIQNIRETRERNKERVKVAGVQQLNQEGKHAEAIERGEEALGTVSEELETILLAELANAYLATKQYEKAFDAYGKHLQMTEKPAAEGLYTLGQDLVRRGQQDPARLAFQKVLELDPNFAEAYYQLGMDYFYELEDKANARKMLEKYLEIGKDEGNLSNARNVLAVMDRG